MKSSFSFLLISRLRDRHSVYRLRFVSSQCISSVLWRTRDASGIYLPTVFTRAALVLSNYIIHLLLSSYKEDVGIAPYILYPVTYLR